MKKKRYDAEFKKEMAQLYLSGSRTDPSLAAELDLHANTIYKWTEQYKDDLEFSFPGSGSLNPEWEAMKYVLVDGHGVVIHSAAVNQMRIIEKD